MYIFVLKLKTKTIMNFPDIITISAKYSNYINNLLLQFQFLLTLPIFTSNLFKILVRWWPRLSQYYKSNYLIIRLLAIVLILNLIVERIAVIIIATIIVKDS